MKLVECKKCKMLRFEDAVMTNEQTGTKICNDCLAISLIGVLDSEFNLDASPDPDTLVSPEELYHIMYGYDKDYSKLPKRLTDSYEVRVKRLNRLLLSKTKSKGEGE